MNVNGLNDSLQMANNALFKMQAARTGNTSSCFQNNFNGIPILVKGGLWTRGLSDGGCNTVYKAEEYSADNPLMRVVTTSIDGRTHEEVIDPTKVNPANATRTELDALTAYLVHEKKLDGLSAIGLGEEPGKGTDYFSTVSIVKKNYYALAETMMKMQHNCHNYAGYLHYKKILDVLAEQMAK